MNKQRQRKALAKKSLAKPKGTLMPVDLATIETVPEWMSRAFRNNHYTVMIDDNAPLDNGSTAIKVLVQRHDDKPFTRHWRELQEIKNYLFGTSAVAIEFYPAQDRLIDDHNIYWLWVYPAGAMALPVLLPPKVKN